MVEVAVWALDSSQGGQMKVLQIHGKDLSVCGPSKLQSGKGICSDQGGGIGVYLENLFRGLRGRGWDVSDIYLSSQPGSFGEVADGSYRLTCFRYRIKPSTVRRLRHIIRQERPDLIHLQSVYELMHPVLLQPLIRRWPVVCTFHDVAPVCFWHTKLFPDGCLCDRRIGLSCVTRGCYRLGAKNQYLSDVVRVLTNPFYLSLYRRVPLIVVPSEYLRDVLIINGFDSDRIRVVPLFTRFGSTQESVPDGSAPPKLLFVGQLSPEKGIRSFLDALVLLETMRWEAVIVGQGSLFSTARRWVADQGLDQRVSFLGELNAEALQRCYRECSVVVMPSLIPESFGLVGIEAMSFGKPVIAFDSGGIRQWLRDGFNGLLTRHGDTDHLASNIRRLLLDDHLRQHLGANALQRVTSEFTLDGHLDRLIEVYRQLSDTTSGSVL